MRLRGIGRLRRVAQNLRDRFISTKALSLVYHRVCEVPSDPQLLCVTPEHFAEHLDVLRQRYQPVPLQRLVEALQDKDLSNRSIAVTFDDGYADNLYIGKPLLERYCVPATVFVTTGYVGEQREFWWDELDRLLLQPRTLPDRLDLRIDRRMYRWELGQATHYSQETFQEHRGWDVLKEDEPSPRQSIYRTLCAILHPLTEKERHKVLDELRIWADTDSMGRPTHRILSSDEVLQLDTGGLIEVGAHTVSHPVLSTLPKDTQRAEIEESKRVLENIVEHHILAFAYPYGSRADYTAETLAIVQRAGFSCACSNFADIVWQGSNRFQLPRVLVRNWDGDEFARQLEGWMNG